MEAARIAVLFTPQGVMVFQVNHRGLSYHSHTSYCVF